jgi:Tfp pilus assembly protein PilN
MSKGADTNDATKQLQDWDPTSVWITSFKDEGGAFKLEGGAQTEASVPQLRKRLAASVHFIDVAEAGGERVSDAQANVSYFKFTITGRLAY